MAVGSLEKGVKIQKIETVTARAGGMSRTLAGISTQKSEKRERTLGKRKKEEEIPPRHLPEENLETLEGETETDDETTRGHKVSH